MIYIELVSITIYPRHPEIHIIRGINNNELIMKVTIDESSLAIVAERRLLCYRSPVDDGERFIK